MASVVSSKLTISESLLSTVTGMVSAGDELENYNIMLYPTPQLPSALTNRTIVRFFTHTSHQ